MPYFHSKILVVTGLEKARVQVTSQKEKAVRKKTSRAKKCSRVIEWLRSLMIKLC